VYILVNTHGISQSTLLNNISYDQDHVLGKISQSPQTKNAL